MSEDIELLAKLRDPFPAHHISKLPKETKSQADARKADKSLIVWKCQVCGGAHHKDAVHLDYVGHAALTDRLLDTDMAWNWEPVAFDDRGLPAFDQQGGLWIRLTVHGVTRLGYGSAAHKPHMEVGAREKEVIGDALRNAAMRFGAALELWHKGDLHLVEEEKPEYVTKAQAKEIANLIKEYNVDEKAFLAWVKAESTAHILATHYDKVMATLADKKPKTINEELGDEVPYQ